MAQLYLLLKKIEEFTNVRIPNAPVSEREISSVGFLAADLPLDDETLYLCNNESVLREAFSVGRMKMPLKPYVVLYDFSDSITTGDRLEENKTLPNDSFTSDKTMLQPDGNLASSEIMPQPDGNPTSSEIMPQPDGNLASNKNTPLQNTDLNADKTVSTKQRTAPSSEMENLAILIRAEDVSDIRYLFRIINEYLKFETRLQREVNTLYHLLYAGRGLDGIVNQAESFLNRPIAILNADYSMIAVSPLMFHLTYGIETSEEGNFLSMQEVESLRRLQIENQIYQNNQAFFIRTEDHPDTNWIFCAIRIQHVMSGYVAVGLTDRADATEHELRLVTELADICAIEMQKHDFFMQRTGLQYETFLNELIEGRFSNLSLVESRFQVLNHHLGKFFCIAILASSEPHNSELFNKQQMVTLRKTFPDSMSVVYKNNIVLLINQDTPVLLHESLTAPLQQFARHNRLKVSLSQPFADILKIRIFYEQALHTLELSDLGDEQLLYFSTNALPEFLFSKCDYKELETGIHYHIFQLGDYDREYHTEFIATLRAYLDHDRNATKAAEYLHIHRTTFFYRVKKIEELLEINISDSRLLFLYELSFKIWDYLSR